MSLNIKLVTVARVDFIPLCEELSKKVGISYDDIWLAFSNGESFSNDSDQVLSRNLDDYWDSFSQSIMEKVLPAMQELIPEGEEIIARVCW